MNLTRMKSLLPYIRFVQQNLVPTLAALNWRIFSSAISERAVHTDIRGRQWKALRKDGKVKRS